jgi:hypothetical protein
MRAVLKTQINKTDRNDARGIAQMMRAGMYRPVHVKTLRSQKLRMLLTHRKSLQSKTIAIENDLRVTLRNFGLKVGVVGTVRFEARIRELVETIPDLATQLPARALGNAERLPRPVQLLKCRYGANRTTRSDPLTSVDRGRSELAFRGRQDWFRPPKRTSAARIDHRTAPNIFRASCLPLHCDDSLIIEGRHEAARVHHTHRRHSGMANGSARAAAPICCRHPCAAIDRGARKV